MIADDSAVPHSNVPGGAIKLGLRDTSDRHLVCHLLHRARPASRSEKVCTVASRLAGHGAVFGMGGAVSAPASAVIHGAGRIKTSDTRQPIPISP